MKKILIVDDLQEIRELIRLTLEMGSYQIFEAQSGEEAIEIAGIKKPDLVILDIMMLGGIDGLETCKLLKKNSLTQKTKVILLSAMGQEIDLQAGFEAGADDYLVKPFSPLELLKKIEDVLA
jgi:DNA-binding response OmpR family regulator